MLLNILFETLLVKSMYIYAINPLKSHLFERKSVSAYTLFCAVCSEVKNGRSGKKNE